jgi:hypothetical protein
LPAKSANGDRLNPMESKPMITSVKNLQPGMVVYSQNEKSTFTIAKVTEIKRSRKKDFFLLSFLCGKQIKVATDCRVSVVGFAK